MTEPALPVLREVQMADDPSAWAAAGFTVVDDCVHVGPFLRVRFSPDEGRTGVSGYSLAASGAIRREAISIGGLSVGLDSDVSQNAQASPHRNHVVGLLKGVVITPDRDALTDAIQAHTDKVFDDPAHFGEAPGGARFVVWPLAGAEVGFEVVAFDPKPADDSMVLMFVVDDIDVAVAAVGVDKLSPKSQYMGRDIVQFDQGSGVNGVHLIAR